MRWIMALFAMVTLACNAQTNHPIVFDKLLSSSGEVLMTNATYRSTFGTKVMFKSGLDLQGFDVASLDTNVLSKLKIDLSKAQIEAQNIAKSNAIAAAQRNAQTAAFLANQSNLIRQQQIHDLEMRNSVSGMPSIMPLGGYHNSNPFMQGTGPHSVTVRR